MALLTIRCSVHKKLRKCKSARWAFYDDESGEVYLTSEFVDLQDAAKRESLVGVRSVIHDEFLYLPCSWIRKAAPEAWPLIAKAERHIRNSAIYIKRNENN